MVVLQAARMASNGTSADVYDADEIAEMCQFLGTLLAMQGTSDVAKEDKDALIPKLAEWKRLPEFQGRLASKAAERCWGQLTDDRCVS